MFPTENADTSGLIYMSFLYVCISMTGPNQPFDPSRFKLNDETATTASRRQRRGSRRLATDGHFIHGPVDVAWLAQARSLGVTALWVGLSLWFLRGLRRSNCFIVSNLMMEAWGVEPDAKTRALRALERAGLITTRRRGKRSPEVTILPTPRKQVETPEGSG